jgi:hypothetical protein
LAQAGKVALRWSTARVIVIPKRPLQYYKCLELGHVRATCVSTAERGHLCYRCGGSGQRAIASPASAPSCPLCQSLGAPVNHRMGGTACTPPKTRIASKKCIPFRETATTEGTEGCRSAAVASKEATSATSAAAAAAVDGRGEDMELAQKIEAHTSGQPRKIDVSARSALPDHPRERGRPRCGSRAI